MFIEAGLSLSAKDCKIDKFPFSILEVMFEKAVSLIQTNGLVIPKPGSSDGSYIVRGTCNSIFYVTPGKRGSFKCDRTCINSTANICEHVIAVAEKFGKLSDFVQWFKRSKLRPSLTGLALNGAPKLVGKKLSNRKRSNKRKAEIESTVDLLVENERSTPNFNFQSLGNFPAASQVTHIPPVQKQFRQMELLMAISVNNHLQSSHHSMFRYIIKLHSSKCPIISF